MHRLSVYLCAYSPQGAAAEPLLWELFYWLIFENLEVESRTPCYGFSLIKSQQRLRAALIDALQKMVEYHLEAFHQATVGEQKNCQRSRAKLYDAFLRWFRRCELDIGDFLREATSATSSLRPEYEPERLKTLLGREREVFPEALWYDLVSVTQEVALLSRKIGTRLPSIMHFIGACMLTSSVFFFVFNLLTSIA